MLVELSLQKNDHWAISSEREMGGHQERDTECKIFKRKSTVVLFSLRKQALMVGTSNSLNDKLACLSVQTGC